MGIPVNKKIMKLIEFSFWTMTAIAIGALIGATILEIKIRSLKSEAIKRKAAEWIVDPETGKTEFYWKPLPNE